MKNNKFYDRFDENEKKLLVKFFMMLNDNLFLNTIDAKLINEDFENAINYYYNEGKTIREIIRILSFDNLGTYYKDDVNNWYPLDNAAKIYPLSMKQNWMSVFRVSYYLKENVVPEVFQIALTYTIKRFPTFRTSIRKGFFWNYIDGIKKRFQVYRDKRIPCSYINVSSFGKQSFKAVYYKNRISIEYFHILTDGYGGIVFLSTLVATYLRLLGKNVDYNEYILNINEKPKSEEVEDEFTKKKVKTKAKSLVDSKALEIDGKLSNVRPCQILHYDLPIKEIKKLSKENNVNITQMMLGFIFLACSYSTSKDGYIKVQVPVNMRRYNASKTLRNYSLYSVICIKKSAIKDINSLLIEIKNQMKEKINEDELNKTMAYTNRLVNSIKLIPLFIKRPIAYFIYGYLGDKVLTTVLSNLGNVEIPNNMKKYVDKMDFSLGTGITNKVLFGMISCNETLTLTITKFTTNSSIENSIYNIMKQYGLNPKVNGSEIYGNKK